MGDNHRGSYRRGAIGATGDQDGQVAARGFGDVLAFLAQHVNLIRRQTRFQPSANDSDGGRDSASLTDCLFHAKSGFDILGIGHAVRDDGGFQCDNRLIGHQSCLYGRREDKMMIHERGV